MSPYLHIEFSDGTVICVPSVAADFYIEKYEADGYEVTGAAECQGCPITDGIDLAAEMRALAEDAAYIEMKLDKLQHFGADALCEAQEASFAQ